MLKSCRVTFWTVVICFVAGVFVLPFLSYTVQAAQDPAPAATDTKTDAKSSKAEQKSDEKKPSSNQAGESKTAGEKKDEKTGVKIAETKPGELQKGEKSSSPDANKEKDTKPADSEVAKEKKSVKPAKKPEKPEPPMSPDEKAIRLTADNFETAYNAGDAKLLAEYFAPDGEIVNQSGEIVKGRYAIQRAFAKVFKENPQTKINILIRSIRFVAPNVAIEDGDSILRNRPDMPPVWNHYMVVHAKQNGRWLMVSARDLPDDGTAGLEEIKQLAWLVGEWIDESTGSLVTTTYRWSDDNRSIISDFTVQIGGLSAMTGTQRISWDPVMKTIRSWMFDSEGGYTEGIWTRSGKTWIIKMTGTTRDGRIASSTNILRQISEDRMTWQSRDRVLGNTVLKDIGEIPVSRRVAKPKQAD